MRSLLSLVAVCAVASALTTRSTPNPAITFDVRRRFNLASNANPAKNFVQYERDRAQQLIARGLARSLAKSAQGGSSALSIPVDNAQIAYTAEIGVGSPPTSYLVDIDVGSSNTFVGAGKPYVKTSTSTQTSNNVSVTFGGGFFNGSEFIDQITLSPELVIKRQSIGVASVSEGFDGIDGLLAIGPADLTLGTLSPDRTSEVPTVVDNLRSQGTIQSSLVSLFFEPDRSVASSPTGELRFGSIDPAKNTSAINFVPITTTAPSSEFWGINQSVAYGEETILNITAGILDSGSSLMLLATDAFTKYQSATGGVFDEATTLLKITPAQFKNLKPLNFQVGSQVYSFTPNAQLFPRILNTAIGGEEDGLYLVVADIGTPSGQGFDFINGYVFLERFYSVYDTDNQRVGLAETAFTNAMTN